MHSASHEPQQLKGQAELAQSYDSQQEPPVGDCLLADEEFEMEMDVTPLPDLVASYPVTRYLGRVGKGNWRPQSGARPGTSCTNPRAGRLRC